VKGSIVDIQVEAAGQGKFQAIEMILYQLNEPVVPSACVFPTLAPTDSSGATSGSGSTTSGSATRQGTCERKHNWYASWSSWFTMAVDPVYILYV